MFDLDERALAGRVLDCCAGSSSFIAELADRGGRGVAADPAYATPLAELTKVRDGGNAGGDQIISDHESRFTWTWYGSPERRQAMRRSAADRFATDYSDRRHNYVAAALPHLPFADRSFELVLCSHLLFTWSNEYGADWHYAAVAEMLRVSCSEIRVFPLVVQGTGEQVPFLDDVLTRVADNGNSVELRRVPFEFQRGANTMLVARPTPP